MPEAVPTGAETDRDRWVRQVDAAFVIGGFAARCLLYGSLYAVAGKWDFGPALLSGIMLGDLAACLASFAAGARERGRSAVELATILGIAIWWWTHGGGVPERPEYQAILALSGIGSFATRFACRTARGIGPDD
ncbi:MAG: hypothetical protein Fur0037_12940 [Planctomycetota bacterium]